MYLQVEMIYNRLYKVCNHIFCVWKKLTTSVIVYFLSRKLSHPLLIILGLGQKFKVYRTKLSF